MDLHDKNHGIYHSINGSINKYVGKSRFYALKFTVMDSEAFNMCFKMNRYVYFHQLLSK